MVTYEIIVKLRRGGSTSFLLQGRNITEIMDKADEVLEDVDYAAISYNPLN